MLATALDPRPRRIVQVLLAALLAISALPLQALIAPVAEAEPLPFSTPQPQWVVPELTGSASFTSQGPLDAVGTVSTVVTSAPPAEAGAEDVVWTGEGSFDGGWASSYWPIGDAADGTYWARMTITPEAHEPSVFDVEIRVDSTMPASVETPVDGAELGDTLDAVLRPTEGYSISGAVTWRMTDAWQDLGSSSAPDPDGAYRLSGADISGLAAGDDYLQASFMWIDGFGIEQYGYINVPVTMVSSIDAELLSSALTFTPNGDGQHDTAALRWSSATSATATVTLDPAGFGDGGPALSPVTLLDAVALEPGEHELDLDGTHDGGDIADGLYDATIELAVPGTRAVVLEHQVRIDRAAPGTLTGPSGGDDVSGTITYEWTQRDWLWASKLEMLEGDTVVGSATWSEVEVDTTQLTPGIHELRPRVTYSPGTGPELTYLGDPVTITVANAVDLTVLSASDIYFTPNGDGQDDLGTVSYSLSGAGTVSAVVRDGAGALVRTLLDEGAVPAGTSTVEWDAKDDEGVRVDDATYRLHLSVHQPGGAITDAPAVRLHTDSWAPEVSFTEPASGATISGTEQRVVVHVGDASVERTSAAYLDIAEGWLGGVGTWAESVDGNGDYVFVVDTTQATDGPNALTASVQYRDRWGQQRSYVVTRSVQVWNELRVQPWYSTERYVVPALGGDEAQVTHQYTVSHAAELTARVVRDGAVVRTLAEDEPVSGEVAVTWDGRDDDGDLLAHGPAFIEIAITDGVTTFEDEPRTGVFAGLPIEVTSPLPGEVSGTVPFRVEPTSSAAVITSASVREIGTWWSESTEDLGSGVWGIDIDSTELEQGDTTLETTTYWTDEIGGLHTYTTEIPISVSNDVTVFVYDDTTHHGWFNPTYGQEPWSTWTPRYERWIELSEPAEWSATIAAPGGAVVRSFPATWEDDAMQVIWDGRDDAGALVPAGTYTITVAATDQHSGAVGTGTFTVDLETTPPGAITSPAAGSVFDGSEPLVLTAADGVTPFTVYYYANETWLGPNPSIDDFPAGEVDVLAQVSWAGADGFQHTSFTDPVTYIVDQSGEVTVPAGDRSFSPDGDGVEDTTDVAFTMVSQGAVTAEVLLDDTVVRTIVAGEQRSRGSQTVTWDGLDDDGQAVAAGEYVVRISSEGSDGTTTSGQVLRTVDLRPVGSVTAPVADATVGNLVHVAFTQGDVELDSVGFCLHATCTTVTEPVDGVWATDLDLGSVGEQDASVWVDVTFTDGYGTVHQWRPLPVPVHIDPNGLWVSAVFDPPSGPAPLSTNLLVDVATASSETLDYTIQWTAGETETGTIAPPYAPLSLAHTFPSQGSFTAVLTVEDGAGHLVQRAITATVTPPPNKKPTATLTLDEVDGREDLTVNATFTASDLDDGPNPLSWIIDWGDGSCAPTGCAASPRQWGSVVDGGGSASHEFTQAGMWPVRLLVTDGQDLRTITQWVKVREDVDPVADVGEDHLATFAGQPVTLDGSPSIPADADAFEWDFDDGTTGDGAVASHTYTSPGTYFPELTVTVGEKTDSIDMIVTVFPEPDPDSGVLVTVTGDGAPLGGATVAWTDASGATQKVPTTSSGEAVLQGLPDGRHTVKVYKEDYVPKAEPVDVVDGKGEVDVALASGVIAEATLEAREASPEELQAAGIDLEDPANRRVIKFETHFAVQVSPDSPPQDFPVSGLLNTQGFTGGGLRGPTSEEDCVDITTCAFDLGNGYAASPSVADADTDEPKIVWLIVPVEGSMLKEFFAVTMVVQNLAPADFVFVDGTATIDLPGSALALPEQDGASQPAEKPMDPIPGGGSGSVQWIVRGDEQGSHDLSATYRGTIAEIGEPVEVDARLAKPLRVYGNSALRYIVEVPQSITKDQPFEMRIGLENVTPARIYDVEIEVQDGDNWELNGPTEPRPMGIRKVDVIEPGTTWWASYDLVPTETGTIDLEQSILRRIYGVDGEDGTSPTQDDEIRFIDEDDEEKPPPPKLQSSAKPGGLVQLTWDAVEDATYEIWATKDLGAGFGLEPLATVSGTEADVPALLNADDTGEAIYQVVSVLPSGKRLLHNLERSSARAECTDGRSGEGGPTIGGWALGDCFSFRGRDLWEATGDVYLNGLKIRPSSPETVVQVDTSTARLSADGAVDIVADLGSDRELVLFTGTLAIDLSAETAGITVGEANLFGLPISGTATLAPEGPDSVRVEVALEVSPVLGGQTAMATFTVGPEGVDLAGIDVQAERASLGTLVGLEQLDLAWDDAAGRWTVEAAQQGDAAGGRLTGWIELGDDGTPVAGELDVTDAHLSGVLTMGSLHVEYGAGRWAITAQVDLPDGGTATAQGHLQYGEEGELTEAELRAERVLMPGLFDLEDFLLEYARTDQGASWTGGGTIQGEGAAAGSEATVDVALLVEAGAVATADISAPVLSLGGMFSLRDVRLHYAAGEGGEPSWDGSADLHLEGSDGPAASISLEVGDGRLQSATGDLADADLGGIVRVIDGHAEYDAELGWRLTAEKASIGELLAVEGLDVSRTDDEGTTWNLKGTMRFPGGTATIAGSTLEYDAAGTLVAGSLDLPELTIAGLVPIDGVTLAFGPEGWSAGGSGAGVDMAFVVTDGALESGHIAVDEAKIGNVVGITDFRIELADGTWTGGAEASLTMPEGVDAELAVEFEATDGVLSSGSLTGSFGIAGAFRVDDVDVSYSAAEDEWTGGARLHLPGAGEGHGVAGSLTFRGGELVAGTLSLTGLRIPIGTTGVFVTGGEVTIDARDPLTMSGTIVLAAGPGILGHDAVTVDGTLTYTFGADNGPGVWEVLGALDLVDIPLGNLTAAFDAARGQFTFGGGLALTKFAPLFSATGSITGTVGMEEIGATGDVELSILGGALAGRGRLEVSTDGLAGCLSGAALGQSGQIGARIPFGGTPQPFEGCDLGSMEPVDAGEPAEQLAGKALRAVFPNAAKAPVVTTGQQEIVLPAGLPMAVLAFQGATAPPQVTLTGPAGERLAADPANPGVQADPRFFVAADDGTDTTYVLVDEPSGGTWTATAGTDNAFAGTQVAKGLPAPQVAAEVGAGEDGQATLTWDLVPREGQVVRFYEVDPEGGRRLIGTATTAGGTLLFTPIGEGTPTIEAVVEQDGFVRRSSKVVTPDAAKSGSLTVALAGAGRGVVTSDAGGIDCGATCEAQVPAGTTVALTATAAAGSRFAGWEGACTGTGACEVTVDALHTVTARFDATAPGGGGGGAGGGGGGGSTGGDLPAGGTTTSDPQGTAPLAVAVTTPVAGRVSITEARPGSAPGGFSLLGTSFEVTAPDATAEDPLRLTFTVDSALPGGAPVVVLRDGVPAARCTGPAGQAVPDPCVSDVVDDGEHLRVTVLSSHASRWDVARPAAGSTAAACAGSRPMPFADVAPGNPHRAAVGCLVSYAVTSGVDATRFAPAAPVTRGQLATFLVRMLRSAGVEVPVATSPFTDVAAAHVHAPSIAALAELGIIRGMGDGRFAPEAPVTRAQAMTFLVGAYELATGTTLPSAPAPFGDVAGSGHEEAIGQTAALGVASGLGDGSFGPTRPLRRDQMASFLARTLNLLVAGGQVPAAG